MINSSTISNFSAPLAELLQTASYGANKFFEIVPALGRALAHRALIR
jgi:hypothetical protein